MYGLKLYVISSVLFLFWQKNLEKSLVHSRFKGNNLRAESLTLGRPFVANCLFSVDKALMYVDYRK